MTRIWTPRDDGTCLVCGLGRSAHDYTAYCPVSVESVDCVDLSITDLACQQLDEERNAHQATIGQLEGARDEIARLEARIACLEATAAAAMDPLGYDPRDRLVDFPFWTMPTSDLLRYLVHETMQAESNNDTFARQTHALRASLLQRELAVRNVRATKALDAETINESP